MTSSKKKKKKCSDQCYYMIFPNFDCFSPYGYNLSFPYPHPLIIFISTQYGVWSVFADAP